MPKNNKDKASFEIIEHIAVLNRESNGAQKEVNLISWNGGRPKIDVRTWRNPKTHEHMSRGLTLRLQRLLSRESNIGNGLMNIIDSAAVPLMRRRRLVLNMNFQAEHLKDALFLYRS